MTKPAFSKILLTAVAAVMLAYMPKPLSARRDGGSHGAEGPMEEALRETVASTVAAVPVVAAALTEVEGPTEEAFSAAAFVAGGTLTSAGADIHTAALAAGRPCRRVAGAGGK